MFTAYDFLARQCEEAKAGSFADQTGLLPDNERVSEIVCRYPRLIYFQAGEH